MQRSTHDVLVHGTAGGLLAGLVVAIWFLIVDLLSGNAFDTPATLASAVLNREIVEPTFRVIAAYTVLHFGVFAVLGVVTAAFFALTGFTPGVLAGAVFGLGVLNTVHYGAVALLRSSLLGVLSVGHVLASNLVAGVILMAYLHRVYHRERPAGIQILQGNTLLTQGLGTGLVGAGAVALWFFLLDLVMRYPFYTPAALGSALFLGAASPDEVHVNVAIVAAFTVVHLLTFWAAGVAFVWVARRIERAPGMWLIAFMTFVVFEGVFVPPIAILGEWVLGDLGWWAIGIANLIAVAAMAATVWELRPRLRESLLGGPVETQI